MTSFDELEQQLLQRKRGKRLERSIAFGCGTLLLAVVGALAYFLWKRYG